MEPDKRVGSFSSEEKTVQKKPSAMDNTEELLKLPYLDFNYTFREKNYLLKLKLKKILSSMSPTGNQDSKQVLNCDKEIKVKTQVSDRSS